MASANNATFDRGALARWYAQRHLRTDAGVQEIHYLPENAPAREIRLLEVNNLIPAMRELEPIDFGVDIDSAEGHVLLVLDVTPAQWRAIQNGKLALPSGWTLDGGKSFRRKSR
jgi:hypothetical protein